MSATIRGRLISLAFASEVLPTLPIYALPPRDIRARMERCGDQIDERLGPASGARCVADVAVLPLLDLLQWIASARNDTGGSTRIHTQHGHAAGPLVVTTAWGEMLDRAWRDAVRDAIATDGRWCLCCNGATLRIVDARRTWSRDYCEFDLSPALRDPQGQAWLWTLLRGDACAGTAPVMDRAVVLSARHGAAVCSALGHGVLEALERLLTALRDRRAAAPVVFDHALTVLYRVLFLLFAEARGLVPLWHPVYRDRYSLEAIVTSLLAGRPCRGVWHAVQAISRLAHAGCSAGELKVTAFNGRLFAPAQTATFDRRPIADSVMHEAVIAVSSTPGAGGRPRTRISYRDLDVEQLGAVYEQVLDYEPAVDGMDVALIRTRDVRKSSGAFYTPRGLATHLVRETLAPLVRGRSSEEILSLRILDPAMGSGAFLVAACRYLAAVTEDALIAEGRWHPGDVVTADRAMLRRTIASRCLYGVDLNPMAVQLGRLSLWLATLAADRPLSFFDHHLVAGDSLVGASPADIQRQPTASGRRGRPQPLPLFEHDGLHASLAEAAAIRIRLATEPDDTAAIVRQKERTLATLSRSSSLVHRWQQTLDLWCAGWFWNHGNPPARGTFGELVDQILHRRSSIPAHSAAALLGHAEQTAAERRFLHWPLTFPEVFAAGGFDAVIGNPPWDMIRGDSGSGAARDLRQRHARQSVAFFRESGIYSVASRAHANRYQLFVERALQLLRPGGRFGLVLPAGIATDGGSGALRRHLFERADVDAITGMDNRAAIFPVHRSVRFALVTATTGRRTERVACRFGLTRVEQLESVTDRPLTLSRELLIRLSGADDLGIPELGSETDLRIVERIAAYVPWLGSRDGWNVRFGRELNATDDRGAFRERTGAADARPVVEGKQLDPFCVRVDDSRFELRPGARVAHRAPRRTRLAYRDIASATNRLTLIAALIPAHAVTTHTVFCLKTPLPLSHQHVLCALLNSFVANYLIRLRVNTHVTAALMARLPVPVLSPDDPRFQRLSVLSQNLMGADDPEQSDDYAELQAIAARLYGLSASEFEHVLGTFPLMPEAIRRAAYERLTTEHARHTEAREH